MWKGGVNSVEGRGQQCGRVGSTASQTNNVGDKKVCPWM